MKYLLIPLLLLTSLSSYAKDLKTSSSIESLEIQQNQNDNKLTKFLINIELYKERDNVFGEKITSDMQHFSFSAIEGDKVPFYATKTIVYPILITNCFGKNIKPPKLSVGLSGNIQIKINENKPTVHLNLKDVVQNKGFNTQRYDIDQEVNLNLDSPTMVNLNDSKMIISISQL